jgi:hypothetical protein
LPVIAEAFEAPELKIELAEFVSQLEKNKPVSQQEWRSHAQKAVALISIGAIVASKMGTLNAEKREELIRIGIEDMYTSVSSRADVIEKLPWIDEDRFEYP